MKNNKLEKVGMLICLIAILGVVTYVWADATGNNRPPSGSVDSVGSNSGGDVPVVIGGKEYILDGSDPGMGGNEDGGFWEELQEKALEEPPETAEIEGEWINGKFRVTNVSD